MDAVEIESDDSENVEQDEFEVIISKSLDDRSERDYDVDIGGDERDNIDNCPVNIDHFELLVKLGNGANGTVFLVQKKCGVDKGHYYALKVITKAEVVTVPKKILDTMAERKSLEILRHCPYIQKLYYAFQTGDKLFLVTEYLPGGDLFTLFQKQRLPEYHVRFYLAELIVALEHIHLHGIVFRDIKLENVVLDAEGHVKLVDVGLCKKLSPRGRTKSFSGTVMYMAPEVIACSGHNTAADWWALGVLAIKLLSSSAPFDVNDDNHHNSDEAIMQKITYEDPKIPADVSADMKDFLSKILNKDVTERLGGSEALATKLKKHRLFSDINWDALEKKLLPAPFVPELRDKFDTKYFDEQFTSQSATIEPSEVPSGSFLIFEGYSYIAPDFNEPQRNNRDKHFINDPESTAIAENRNSLTWEIFNNCDPDSKFHQKYKFTSNEPLGIGESSVCMRCCDLSDQKIDFAVKIYKLEHKNATEIEFLRKATDAGSPGVPNLREVLTDTKWTYLIMELVEGMDLLQYFATIRSSKVKRIALSELSEVVDVVHRLQYTHGRICFKNIRFLNSGKSRGEFRLLGFTKAKTIRHEQDKWIDYWSLGVCTYTVLCGHSPFDLLGNDMTVMIDRIVSNNFDQQSQQWKALSEVTKNVVVKLLNGSSETFDRSEWQKIKCPSRHAVHSSKELIDENKKIVDIRAAMKSKVKKEVLTDDAHYFDKSKIEISEPLRHSEQGARIETVRKERKAKALLKPEEIKKEVPMTLRPRGRPPAKEKSTPKPANKSKKRILSTKSQQNEAATITEPPRKVPKLDATANTRFRKERSTLWKSHSTEAEIIPTVREPLNAAPIFNQSTAIASSSTQISDSSSSSQSKSTESRSTIEQCIHATNCSCFWRLKKKEVVYYTFERFNYKNE